MTATFTLSTKDADADGIADELERIAAMIRDGFTSGESAGGWWAVADLRDPEHDA
jgi:hypothetical protein